MDWVAWDPYNFAACRNRAWQSFEQSVRPFCQWLQANGFGTKPFMLAEYGTVERPGQPDAKAQWLASVPAAMGRLSNLRALIYFDLPSPPANCHWWLLPRLARSAPTPDWRRIRCSGRSIPATGPVEAPLRLDVSGCCR